LNTGAGVASVKLRGLQLRGRTLVRDPWILAAPAAGFALRLVHLGTAPFWLDEVITAEWMRLPWTQVVAIPLHDNHPPLYFLLLKVWTLVAGDSTWALRLPSVIASAAAIPLVAVAAGAFAGRSAGRWAAWFAGLSPYLVQHGQEARMYALVACLAAGNLVFFARWVRDPASRLGTGFVLTALGLVASHYYSIFFLGGEILVVLALWRRPLRSWLPATAVTSAIAATGLCAAMLVASHKAGGSYDLGSLALPGALWALIAGYAALPDSAELHAVGAQAVTGFLPFAVVGSIPVAVTVLVALRGLDREARLALLVPFGVVVAVPFLVHIALGVAVNPRYLMAAAPGLLVLLATGAARWRVAGGAITLVLAIGLGLHLAQPGHGREDTRSVGVWLDAHVPADEEILITSSEMKLLADYQWPSRRFRLYPPAGVVANPDNAAALAAAMPLPGPGRVVFVVGRSWLTDPSGALVRALQARCRACPGVRVKGIDVLCFEAPDGPVPAGDTSRGS
jgi:4-amino-4-deoxy-L-arabinose transferase-like glycosyltransferase